MLRIPFRMKARRLSKAMGRLPDGHGTGPEGRIGKLRKVVTALVRHERIEGKQFYLDEARGYAELLLQAAQKHGDTDKATMEMADYWLLEKDLIPKLFKVLAPRYQNFPTSYTSIYRLPSEYPGRYFPMAILELKDNPWPPVITKERDLSKSLVNVLLQEAAHDYRRKKLNNDDSNVNTEMNPHSEQGTPV